MDLVFTGNSENLAQNLAEKMLFAAFPSNVKRFACGEMSVSLRKSFHEVIIVASTETNNDWIELFLLLDALRDASRIILCFSYLGYSRQDRQNQNESFAARMFAKFIETFPISHCIVIDNHSEPFLRIPTHHISAHNLFQKDITTKYATEKIIIVSPDVGATRKAYELSRNLKCGFVICNKEKNIFGELKKITHAGDVRDKICIIVDDMVDSGATLLHVSDTLFSAGCENVVAYCTHAVLSHNAIQKLEKSQIAEIVVTNTIERKFNNISKFRKLPIDSLIIDTIQCIL